MSDRKIVDYFVHREPSITTVSELIKQGWHPYGYPHFQTDDASLHQAMVKYEGEKSSDTAKNFVTSGYANINDSSMITEKRTTYNDSPLRTICAKCKCEVGAYEMHVACNKNVSKGDW